MRADVFDRLTDNGSPRRKPRRVGDGIGIDERGDLYVTTNDGARVALVLKRARVITIGADGLIAEGFEERARGRFVRRELWARMATGTKEGK